MVSAGRMTCGIEQISDLDEKIEAGQPCSDLTGGSGASLHKSEPAYIFLRGMLGLVVPLTR